MRAANSFDLGVLMAAMLLLRVGHMLLIAGSVRSKNSAATAVRLLLDVAVATLALWCIGSIFVAPPKTPDAWLTLSHFLGGNQTGAIALASLPLILLATGPIHAATGERTRGVPVLMATILFAIVLPLIFRIDRALRPAGPLPPPHAAAIAATVGGAAGLVLAWAVGPRKGKFNRDRSANFIPGHHVLLQVAGLLIFLIASFVIAPDVLHPLVAGSAAMLAAAAFGRWRFGKIDTGLMIAGTIGGVVAVLSARLYAPQPAADVAYAAINSASVCLIGLIAGVVVPWAVITVETRFRIDDVSGIGTAHLVGGVVGLPLVGLLSWGEAALRLRWAGGGLIAAMLAIAVGVAIAAAVAIVAKKLGALRVSEGAEFDGLDLTDLDLNGYPDFQQNMIKSYHLREM